MQHYVLQQEHYCYHGLGHQVNLDGKGHPTIIWIYIYGPVHTEYMKHAYELISHFFQITQIYQYIKKGSGNKSTVKSVDKLETILLASVHVGLLSNSIWR